MDTQHFPIVQQVIHLTVWLAILTLVFVTLERAFTLRPAPGRSKELPRDIAYYFINNIVPTTLLALCGAVLASTATRLLPGGWLGWVASWPIWARSLAVFVVGEIGYYWGHRWMHVNPFLWRFHAVHHAAEHVDWLTNTRAHPLDMIFGRLCGLLPAYALGLMQPVAHGGAALPVIALIASQLFGIVWSFFIHANIRWRFGAFEHLLASPAFHHWHHTNDRVYRDRNFASTLPILDRLFGTLHLPRTFPEVYGIDTPMDRSLAGQLLDPLTPGRTAPLTAPPA
jgi:sterol desaturase/sphingolipid hydroxylase (fatty acid hydroxylase superfamily)